MWMSDERTVRDHAGFVGDWCPLCGDIEYMSAAYLRRRRRAPVFRGMSLLDVLPTLGLLDELAGRSGREPLEVTCIRCRSSVIVEASRYCSLVPKADDPPEALARRTLADRGRAVEERRAEHAASHAPDADTEKRVQHIVRAIRTVDLNVRRRHGPGTVSALQAVVVVLLFLSVPVPVVLHHVRGWTLLTIASVLLPVLLFAALLWPGLESGRRHVRRVVAPRLGRAIASIRPTLTEIRAAIDQTHLKTTAKMLRAEHVARAVDHELSAGNCAGRPFCDYERRRNQPRHGTLS